MGYERAENELRFLQVHGILEGRLLQELKDTYNFLDKEWIEPEYALEMLKINETMWEGLTVLSSIASNPIGTNYDAAKIFAELSQGF